MTDDDIGAFVPGQQFRLDGAADGPLAGLTFAAKDLFNVAGRPTGGGNPDFARQNPVPTAHAWAVQRLLDSGASLIGKTVTDEVSLGILGENAFFGTPRNSKAPDRVPGGSSSGSAAAVAAGLCDTALGTDTGGSVRVPASFCGLYGIRPTHGSLPLDGMLPQAPNSDTAGWFARDAATFRRVSEAMFGDAVPDTLPSHLVIATDAFGLAELETSDALRPLVRRLAGLIGETHDDMLAPQGLSAWGRAQRVLQPREAWATFKPWIERDNPALAFNVARGLLLGASITDADIGWASVVRQEARARLAHLLPPGTVLAMPTTPFPAPLKGLPLPEQNTVREAILCLCAHGGLAGFPQISIPGTEVDGLPVGLSLLAARGEDLSLVAVAEALENA